MFAPGIAVSLSGRVEGVMFAEGAPESMQSYVVRLSDGQLIQTNCKNLCSLEVVPVEEVPDLVPTAYHCRHEAKPKPDPKPPKAKAKPPSSAKLPSVDRP
jgi:hypothetical protein